MVRIFNYDDEDELLKVTLNAVSHLRIKAAVSAQGFFFIVTYSVTFPGNF